MSCPICGLRTYENVCPQCGADIALYRKIKSTSNVFYNKGLDFAYAGDITRAIESLTKSVGINGDNINARNLLGLCYFHIGKVGDALKQWIVSASISKSDNEADFYIETVQKDSRALDKLNDAVKMYNQSIAYLRSRSEDMAIIQLKKAAELSPNFTEVYNLLALCYIKSGDYNRALISAEKSLSIDSGNTTAATYIRRLGGKTRTEVRKQPPGKPKTEYTRIAPSGKNAAGGKRLGVAGFFSFILGALISLAVFYYLVVPDIAAENEILVNAAVSELENERLAHALEIAEKDGEIEKALEANYVLAQENGELKSQIEITGRIQIVQGAYALLQDQQLEEAVSILKDLDTSGLPVDITELYDKTFELALPQLSLKYYNKGMQEYNRGQSAYADAEISLLACVGYHHEESKYTGDALYFLGRIAEYNQNTDLAKEYYTRVLDEFPGANQFYNARTRLDRL